MTTYGLLITGVFLPVFPLSMVFNALFNRLGNGPLRAVLLLAWPQLGLSLLFMSHPPHTDWLLAPVLLTSALYGFRAIAVREVGHWIGYLATSAWALLWVAFLNHADPLVARLAALGFSLPLVLLALLATRLERRFGAAYVGLYGGLAQTLPRMSAVLVCVVLASIAAPLFPSFFAMLSIVIGAIAYSLPAAVTVAAIWVIWSWAGVRLLQGLIVGAADGADAPDLSLASTWAYSAVLVTLLVGSIYTTGGVL